MCALPPKDLPTQGSNLVSWVLHPAGRFFSTGATWSPTRVNMGCKRKEIIMMIMIITLISILTLTECLPFFIYLRPTLGWTKMFFIKTLWKNPNKLFAVNLFWASGQPSWWRQYCPIFTSWETKVEGVVISVEGQSDPGPDPDSLHDHGCAGNIRLRFCALFAKDHFTQCLQPPFTFADEDSEAQMLNLTKINTGDI